jgi:hypothetical protein
MNNEDKMVEAARDEMNKAATKFIAERPAFPSANPYIPKYMADFAIGQVEPFATALRDAEQTLEAIECLLIREDLTETEQLVLIANYFIPKEILADTPLTGE